MWFAMGRGVQVWIGTPLGMPCLLGRDDGRPPTPPTHHPQPCSTHSPTPTLPAQAHPSVGALLAWRYAQLLTALPRRGTEAATWARLGRALFEEAPVARASVPETIFGSLDNLQGRGQAGSGVVLDLLTRRALPCQPEALQTAAAAKAAAMAAAEAQAAAAGKEEEVLPPDGPAA